MEPFFWSKAVKFKLCEKNHFSSESCNYWNGSSIQIPTQTHLWMGTIMGQRQWDLSSSRQCR